MTVAVIGAGVIGLSIAWRLARQKIPVQVFEARCAGRQASWAAAGMLTPYSEAVPLGSESFALYPQFLRELSHDSGIQVSCDRVGTLYVSTDLDHLRSRFLQQRRQQLPVKWLDEDEVHSREPLLSRKVVGGIEVLREGQLNNRRLLAALLSALQRFEVPVYEHTPIAEVMIQETKVTGVKLSGGNIIHVSSVVNCAGAWASQLSITPIKGQIVTVRGLSLTRVVTSSHVYLVPKDDGTVRIGATSEKVGYDETVTAGAVRELLNSACELVPSVEKCVVESIDVGLRPQAPNDHPFVGATSIAGYYVATGHGRSGVLLAPITAQKIAKEITEGYAHTT